jgi:hypothetical protein
MDTNNNSGGRGRGRPAHEVPSMPVFLGAARSRKQLQVVASGPVARELELYTDWASGVAMMPEDEVLVRVIDHALTECFRSDKKWQREKAEFAAAEAARHNPAPGAAGAKASASAAPAATERPTERSSGSPAPAVKAS